MTIEEAYEKHARLITHIIYQWRRGSRSLSYEDVQSLVWLAFVKAFRTWDPARAQLSTIITIYARNLLIEKAKKEQRWKDYRRAYNERDGVRFRPDSVHALSEDVLEVLREAESRLEEYDGEDKIEVRRKLKKAMMGKGWTHRRWMRAYKEARSFASR